MKKALAAFFTLILSISGTNVMAQSYWGLGAGSSSFDLMPLGIETLEDGTAIRFVMGDTRSGYEMDISIADYDWATVPESEHTTFNLIFSGVKYVPINENFSVFGKIGLNLWSADVTLLGTEYEGDSGINVAASAGLDIAVSKNFHISAEYQVLPGLGDGLDEGDVSQLLFNVIFYR